MSCLSCLSPLCLPCSVCGAFLLVCFPPHVLSSLPACCSPCCVPSYTGATPSLLQVRSSSNACDKCLPCSHGFRQTSSDQSKSSNNARPLHVCPAGNRTPRHSMLHWWLCTACRASMPFTACRASITARHAVSWCMPYQHHGTTCCAMVHAVPAPRHSMSHQPGGVTEPLAGRTGRDAGPPALSFSTAAQAAGQPAGPGQRHGAGLT